MKFDLFCPVHCPPHLLWAYAPPTEGYHWTFIYLFILLLNESTEYLIICFPICLFNYNDNRYYPHDMWGLLYFDVLMILPVGERLALCTHYMFHTFTGNISKYEVTILRQIRHFGSTTNLAGLEWTLSGVVFCLNFNYFLFNFWKDDTIRPWLLH